MDNTIVGAGTIGSGDSLSLENRGLIVATGSNPLIIDTGDKAIANTGILESRGGALDIKSVVTGAGRGIVDGGTLEFNRGSDVNVSFSSDSGGLLQFDRSDAFTGTIADFAAGDALDLTDMPFAAGITTLGYAANETGTGGSLTLSNGTQTANLALLGQYAAAAFQMTSDGHGGTLINYTATQTDPNVTLASSVQHVV
jgi:hypothetical protein